MKLEELEPVEERISHSLHANDLRAVVELGEEVQSDLTEPELLREVSRRVAEIAEDRGVDVILGASSVGERIAGAAVALGSNGLRPLGGTARPRRVLIVDGVLLSGAQLERALAVAAEAGADEASAVVVVGPRPSDRVLPEKLRDLVVLADR